MRCGHASHKAPATIRRCLRRQRRCEYCGNPATCLGRYEAMTSDTYACDRCCGHGCEDGRCEPLAGIEVDRG